MTIDFADFFGKAGKAFHALDTLNTAMGTTIEDEVEDFVQQFGSDTIQEINTFSGVADALESLQSAGTAMASEVSGALQNLLVYVVEQDNPQSSQDIEVALIELVRQMEISPTTVSASAVGATVSYDSSNVGDGVIVVSVKRPDGRTNELLLAEDIVFTCGSEGAEAGGESFTAAGEEYVSPLAHDWPKGSGASFSAASTTATTGNVLSNGTFEDADTLEADLPDGWVASVATFGTTLKLTDIEVQTVIISGSPTGGWYSLTFTNSDGDAQTTAPISWDAGESDVQSALRLLTGLSAITVTTTGTSPNYTHTIEFVGVKNPGQLTSTDAMTGGSPAIAHATTTAASAHTARGARAVEFDGNGSELTAIQQRVALTPRTQYAFAMFLKLDVVPAAGVITVDLVDGIGGTVIADDEATNNTFTIDCTAASGSLEIYSGVFRTPTELPAVVYLRIRLTTAITAGSSAFIDEAQLKQMDEAYDGGPYIAVFSGLTAWGQGDRATVATTNDRAGSLHEWMDRAYDLKGKGLLLPSTGGAPTIADSVIG